MMNHDEDAALRIILEGTAGETGEMFFASLVKSLAQAMNTHAAWVTEYLPESRSLRALAFWMGDDFLEGYQQVIDGTPCEAVIEEARLVHLPDNVMALYPEDPELIDLDAVSYLGVPLLDSDGTVVGHLAVLDTQPLPPEPRALAVFRIFAARAAAELRRIRAEAAVREREERLTRLIDSAMDGILELDHAGRINSMNQAAESIFECSARDVTGKPCKVLFTPESCEKLMAVMTELGQRPKDAQYMWIPEALRGRTLTGSLFPAEASLSRFEVRGRTYHTLILRNVNDRIEADRRIRELKVVASYLREEISAHHNFHEIIGASPAIGRVIRDIQQVAETESTVLILGETGTGKELVARAIHQASPRAKKPLIRVNCAAIPAALMESEFFGHERGAFTGATQPREGRFALADGGTLFLDEVGELPLELQSKLLRVLQEGEFEPVGSAKTRRVNVRVIAATNRALEKSVESGDFREDLYYRLNVFPLPVPPLRERLDDIPLIADVFIERFARAMGRKPVALSPDDEYRLRKYPWPGNVRELENVIERALITAQDGQLNLDRALPDVENTAPGAKADPNVEVQYVDRILSVTEFEDLERKNIIRALEKCNGRVAGDRGAARLLGMNPSTLSSRLRALGIKRPAR